MEETTKGIKQMTRVYRYALLGAVVFSVLLILPDRSQAQPGLLLFVDVVTGDRRFAGTDDEVSFSIGGILTVSLDDPDRDDRERDNTDSYQFPVNDSRFTVDWLRGARALSVNKHEDSFFGGGWYFESITIWLGSKSVDPIYQNLSVNKWLDGDDLSWSPGVDDSGWNIPDPTPPTCTTPGDVDTGEGGSVDSDCDGIPDESDTSFDPPNDEDGDGLPDRYEDLNGTDSTQSDSDGDGWSDGKMNRRSALLLTKIEAIDEEEDFGRDELYLISEDVRFPERQVWPMNDDSVMETWVLIDSRATGPGTPLDFRTRLRLRESDFEIFQSPTDDTFASFDLAWSGEEGTTVETLDGDGTLSDDFEYRLHFRWFTVGFSDPQPRNVGGMGADREGDGLPDFLEFQISSQAANLRPAGQPAATGYNGLADPEHRELFVEIDAVGGDHRLKFDAKQQVASRFYHEKIRPRFDEGYLGGGEVLPYVETVSFSQTDGVPSLKTDYKPNNFWPQRANHFRYGLTVDKLAGVFNGRADAGGVPGTDLVVARTTLVGEFGPIVLIHELGHTLGLCHPQGTQEPPIPSPTCPVPPDWDGDPATMQRECTHYCGVGDDDATAMGDDVGWSTGGTVAGGLLGAVGGAAAGAGVGFVVGGPPGAIVGAVIGGVGDGVLGGGLGGFLGSDAYQREVDFHSNEWAALRFW